MDLLRTLNINYPALADGECQTLHPFLESYEVELVSDAMGAEETMFILVEE